jgi:hypothetical protein
MLTLKPMFCRGRWQGFPYPELIDARGTGLLFPHADVRRIVALLRKLGKESHPGRTAVAVPSDYALGLIRVIEMTVEDVCQADPFLDEQEARAWLAGE